MSANHNGNSGNAFRERLFKALMTWQGRHGKELKQEDLGLRVAKQLHRKSAFTQAAVSRWFTKSVPDLEVIEAIASVLEVRASWLAFGEGEQPPPPPQPTPMPRPEKK